MYVTHDRVHLPLKMTMSVSLFASFANWIKASLPNNAIVSLQRLSHLMPVDHFFSGNFEQQGACNFATLWSGGSFAHIWHDLLDVWLIIWLWWDRTCRTCSIAVSFVLESEVDMLQMWVQKRTRAENNPYQSLPKTNLDNLQWSPKLLNAISVCHVY